MARPIYRGIAEGININDPSGIYGVGFGPGDLRRALIGGYDAGSVISYLQNSYRGAIAPGMIQQLRIVSQQQQQQDDAAAQQAAYEEQNRALQAQIQEQTRIAEEQMRQQQRQLQISSANQGMAGSGQVQFSQSKADRKKLTSAGTAGYFGRQGLRIKGLNVAPTTTSTAGSFA